MFKKKSLLLAIVIGLVMLFTFTACGDGGGGGPGNPSGGNNPPNTQPDNPYYPPVEPVNPGGNEPKDESTITNITSVAVIINSPVKGNTPHSTASGTGNFTIGVVSWSPNDNPFLGGKVYTATVTLTANSNCTFSGLTSATVNGQSAAVSNNTGTTVKLSYTFPATNTKTVTNITIKSEPYKLTYTHGDPLDLSGLTVTLIHDDNTTEDVAASDFTDKNITASPSHGNNLAYLAYNGLPVTVVYGDLWDNTNVLTVNKKPVTITGIGTVNKVYDGSTYAEATYNNAVINGKINSDYVYISYGTALFTDKNVGNNKTVTFSGYSLGGTDAGNYYLSSQPPNITSSITPKSLTITSVTAVDRAYDGTTTVALSGGSLVGVISGDTVGFKLGSGTIATATAGNNKAVTTNIQITGASADNYTLTQPSVTVNILPVSSVETSKIEYYWVDDHGSLVTTSGNSVTVAAGATLTITAQGTGYVVKQWHLDGVNTGQSGNAYNFSSMIAGKHNIGLFVEKDSKLYNTNIVITVVTGNGSEANPFPLTAAVWENGSITSSTNAVWYSFDVTNGTMYRIWWNDSYQGNSTKTLDVKVDAKYSNGTSIFTGVDSAYSSAQSFTANQTGTVKIKVYPYSSGTGTFALVYSTSSTRP
jgi:hypothetical protein